MTIYIFLGDLLVTK